MAKLKSCKKLIGTMADVSGISLSIRILEAEAVKKAKDFLTNVLALNNGKIEFHTYDEDGYQEDDNSFCVPYDGGNHPEYASNCFSDVESVYMHNNDIYLEIEDCDAYPLTSLDNSNIIELSLFIYEELM